MKDAVLSRVARAGRFVWSGWAGLAGLALFAALWQAGHEAYGSFILPAPLDTIWQVLDLLMTREAWDIAGLTLGRAIQGFCLAGAVGTVAGMSAGYSPATMRLARPILTLVLGVPPIAWIVLAMIWFGSTDGTVVTTVVVAATPMIFIGAAEGALSRDRGLDAMARAFGIGPINRFRTLGLRQVATHLFPALIIALGTAFKVAVMAELLANTGGIGGALASARSNLDVALALAWVLIAVCGLIAAEYGLVQPIRAEVERWRDAARPWGVKK